MAEPTTKSAFVTGGTGFVGSHLVEALQARGYGEIRCLVRNTLRWLDGLDIVPVQVGLDDLDGLKAAVEGVDYVYHVAGVTRAKDWATLEQANVLGTLNLLDAVAEVNPDVKRVLITSSLEAVGPCANGVADEAVSLNPVTRYGRSKALMEHRIAEGNYAARLPLVTIRPPAVYGPRESDIYTFFQSLNRGLAPILGKGTEPDLSLVFAKDLVHGMIDAAEADETVGETYFLGGPKQYSWHEIRDAALEALGKKALTLHVPVAAVEPIGAVLETVAGWFGQYPPMNREKAKAARYTCTMCSSQKAQEAFGYAPTTALSVGMEETIAWYRANDWL
ncbi:MAG: NAD-dependent epimerase/dehydratase family protein [Rhodothermales bacterium]